MPADHQKLSVVVLVAAAASGMVAGCGEEHVATMPIVGECKEAAMAYLREEDRRVRVEFKAFDVKPLALGDVPGYVVIRSREVPEDGLNSLLNAVIKKCYPDEANLYPTTTPGWGQKLENDFGVMRDILHITPKRAIVEKDLITLFYLNRDTGVGVD